MLSINTNISSLIAQQSMSSATNKLNQAIERMTTGYKINGAKDNAANYSISTNMTTKINSYMVAEDNVAMGLDMLSTANGSLGQISDKLTRLRALATQASNGTYGQQSLTAINSEANALVDEINRIYSTAEYNGKKLFTGSETNTTPAVAAYGARAASTNTTYTDEEVAAMKTLTEAYNENSLSSGETYSISTAEELAILGDLSNTGYSVSCMTFVLAKDIDLSSVSNWIAMDGESPFDGTFDGNGHVISNLTIDTANGNQGLFGTTVGAIIKNLGLENVNIKGGTYTGGLIGHAYETSIENCYVTGSVEGENYVGGLVGRIYTENTNKNVKNCFSEASVTGLDNVGGLLNIYNSDEIIYIETCYATGDVKGSSHVGGFIGYSDNSAPIEVNNCYSTGDVTGDSEYGGFLGYSSRNPISITNCYVTGSVSPEVTGYLANGFTASSVSSTTNCASVQESDYRAAQMTAEEIAATYTPESMGFTEANGWTIVDGQPVLAFSMVARNANGGGLGGSNYVTLQVGINADSYSQIGLEFGFALDGIEGLRQIGLDTSTDYLSTLDNMLDIVSAKATEYGAAQNRLESALDEIAIQYDNLVSSRSTLRDADIAEVSSLYIQQQILQQASATLLATANQSPSIALQLI